MQCASPWKVPWAHGKRSLLSRSEGHSILVRPGDNEYDCAQGYSCPNPTVTIDPYVPEGNRYFIVGAGGPASFNWTATTNVSWLTLSPSSGYITPNAPETYVYASVDWSELENTTSVTAFINFNATAANQPMMSQQVYFMANYTSAPSNFTGTCCLGRAVR